MTSRLGKSKWKWEKRINKHIDRAVNMSESTKHDPDKIMVSTRICFHDDIACIGYHG